MHYSSIQAHLKRRGYTQAQIADTCQVSPSLVSLVIRSARRNQAVANAIAAAAEQPINRLWPGQYNDTKGDQK